LEVLLVDFIILIDLGVSRNEVIISEVYFENGYSIDTDTSVDDPYNDDYDSSEILHQEVRIGLIEELLDITSESILVLSECIVLISLEWITLLLLS